MAFMPRVLEGVHCLFSKDGLSPQSIAPYVVRYVTPDSRRDLSRNEYARKEPGSVDSQEIYLQRACESIFVSIKKFQEACGKEKKIQGRDLCGTLLSVMLKQFSSTRRNIADWNNTRASAYFGQDRTDGFSYTGFQGAYQECQVDFVKEILNSFSSKPEVINLPDGTQITISYKTTVEETAQINSDVLSKCFWNELTADEKAWLRKMKMLGPESFHNSAVMREVLEADFDLFNKIHFAVVRHRRLNSIDLVLSQCLPCLRPKAPPPPPEKRKWIEGCLTIGMDGEGPIVLAHHQIECPQSSGEGLPDASVLSQGFPGVVVHQNPIFHQRTFALLDKIFQFACEWDPQTGDMDQFISLLALYRYISGYCMRYERGAAAIDDWIVATLCVYKGFKIAYTGNMSPGGEVVVSLSFASYLQKFRACTRIEKGAEFKRVATICSPRGLLVTLAAAALVASVVDCKQYFLTS